MKQKAAQERLSHRAARETTVENDTGQMKGQVGQSDTGRRPYGALCPVVRAVIAFGEAFYPSRDETARRAIRALARRRGHSVLIQADTEGDIQGWRIFRRVE